MTRILVAVNDSPAGLAAARTAIRLARETSGQVRAVHAVAPRAGEAGGDERARSSMAVLDYVADLAQQAGVAVETATVPGAPARVILDQAAAWPADVIVLGRSGVRHVGQPFVGSQVLHVIEFAEVPVVVVPALTRISP
ncbi:MAG: universal stress protein [Candidatus Nanopelagicales bacterium]|jgi:nucleotide-binding universal stress UspA family protein|nr:universal stress protein [Candidatus Nanopelagicales bacterium]